MILKAELPGPIE